MLESSLKSTRSHLIESGYRMERDLNRMTGGRNVTDPKAAVETLKGLENQIGVRTLDDVAKGLREAGVLTSGCEIKTFITESVRVIEKLLRRNPHIGRDMRRAEHQMARDIKRDVRRYEHRLERK